MTIPLARTVRKLKQAISRRLPQRRDDSGLTTLEWLLIVAAVAGMAALAVVLVTRVVGDTSDQIAGQSARKTAAELAAIQVTDSAVADLDALGAEPTAPPAAKAKHIADVAALDAEFKSKCDRLNLIYGDVDGLDVEYIANGTVAATPKPAGPACYIAA